VREILDRWLERHLQVSWGMRAQDLMSHPAITCHVNDTLQTAAQLMWDHDCGALPVVTDEGKVTGVITDRDICMAAYTQGRSLDALLVNSAMGRHVVAAKPDDRLETIEHLMIEHQVRRVPVVDAAGAAVGMVSLNDLAQACFAPQSRTKQGPENVAHTLAAIGRPRSTTAPWKAAHGT
jgi:CBS-domain-containing membrane protein